jgi:glutathione S-transferase
MYQREKAVQTAICVPASDTSRRLSPVVGVCSVRNAASSCSWILERAACDSLLGFPKSQFGVRGGVPTISASEVQMALTIYGSPRSRTMRTLWVAVELGLKYEHVPVQADDPWLKEPAFLRLNSAGTVPTIDHDGFGLGESLAINLYLAKTFGSTSSDRLYPSDAKAEAEVWRWTLWAQGHLEPWVRREGGQAVYKGPLADVVLVDAHKALGHLEEFLAAREWLVGDHFTIADLNVACVLSPSRVEALDMRSYGQTKAWLARCYGRPAALVTRAKFSG